MRAPSQVNPDVLSSVTSSRRPGRTGLSTRTPQRIEVYVGTEKEYQAYLRDAEQNILRPTSTPWRYTGRTRRCGRPTKQSASVSREWAAATGRLELVIHSLQNYGNSAKLQS